MRIKIVSVVFRKEITDIIRDRRALIISVIVPLLLFPASFFAMNLNLKKTSVSLEAGIPAYVNVTENKIKQSLFSGGKVKSVESSDPEADLKSGKIAALIEEVNSGQIKDTSVQITFDNTSQFSMAAGGIIEDILVKSLNEGGPVLKKGDDLNISTKTLVDGGKGSGIMMLQMIIPMVIFIFSAAAPMAVAADLFAGERERGTLEHLLSVPVTGGELLAGKYLAGLCAGIIGVISFVSGIALSTLISPGVFGTAGLELSVSVSAFTWTVIYSVLILMMFTSAEFVISIFSRSAKEAQILFIPVLIAAMAFGQTVTMIDVKRIDYVFRHIPVVNSGLILKELMTGIFSLEYMALSVFWCTALTAFFLYISRIMLSKEKYIFRS